MSPTPRFLPKIVAPRPGSGAILRERLIGRLQAASDRKLALLVGGAGFGKTTLMAQWRECVVKAGARVVWLTLAAGDGALAQCSAILASALEHGGWRNDAEPPPCGETAPAEAHAAWLLDAFARMPGESYLMIDDFHHVQDPATLRLVQALADAILPDLHLVIASRTMPALRLGRLRAMDELVMLDGAELTFDLQETAAFLKARADVPLGSDTVRHVFDITEGWPVGVRLAGRTRHAVQMAAVERGGDGDGIDDYLSEEVFEQLPAGLLDFMLCVSVLRVFQVDLAASMTGRADAGTLVDELLGRHVFLRCIDRHDEQPWYRFHPMLAAYLEKRRAREGIDPAPLHRRAAQWFLRQGRFGDAMRSAALCNDLELATALVDGGLPPAYSLTHLGVVARWTESVGAARMVAHPRLLRMAAWACALTMRFDQAERWLSCLDAGEDGADSANARHRLLLRALIATHRDDDAAALAALRELGALPPQPMPDGLADMELGLRLRWLGAQGRYLEARCLYNAPAARDTRTGHGELALIAAAAAAGVAMREGNALEADRIGAAALRRARTIHGDRSLCAMVCATVAAQAWLELDRVDDAAQVLLYYRTALRAASPGLKLQAAMALGKIKALREAPQDALAYLCRVEAHFRALGVDRAVAHVVAEQQRIVLSYGDRRHAQALQAVLDEYVLLNPGGGTHDTEIGTIAALARARLAVSLGAPDDALAALDVVRRLSGEAACGRLQATADLLRARALDALGRAATALASAQSALATCYRLGLHRTLVEEGECLHAMLCRAASHGGAALVGHVRNLLGEAPRTVDVPAQPAAMPVAPPATVPPGDPAPPRGATATPALTRRELEVLALLEQSMSNKRIALTLNISVQTVKWNLKKIFVKLQVTSRYEAIVAARQLAICEH